MNPVVSNYHWDAKTIRKVEIKLDEVDCTKPFISQILLDYCKITVIISNNYVHDHCEQKSAVT